MEKFKYLLSELFYYTNPTPIHMINIFDIDKWTTLISVLLTVTKKEETPVLCFDCAKYINLICGCTCAQEQTKLL